MQINKIHNFLKKISLKNISIPYLTKMRVFFQILVIIIIMLFFLAIQGYISFNNIDAMQQNTKKLFGSSVQYYDSILGLRTYFQTLQTNYLTKLSRAETFDINTNQQSIEAIKQELPRLKDLDPVFVGAITEKMAIILSILNEPTTQENSVKLQQNFNIVYVSLDQLRLRIGDNAINTMNNSEKTTAKTRRITIIILILSILLPTFIGLIIAASISRPLKRIADTAKSLATGDLSKKIETQGCLEVTYVVKDLNLAIEGLNKLVKGINEQADTLANSSKDLETASNESGKSAGEVARAMQELANGAGEQSNQLLQTVSAVNELTDLVNKVSVQTEQITITSKKVAESAKRGEQVTSDVANEIDELYRSTTEIGIMIEELSKTSEEITEITTLITNIAEQTALLALNAAIEAARAGEHGKGFSVVAKETTKLADQSKQAAQLIASLILQMGKRTEHAVSVIQKEITKVEAGKALASNATVTFQEIFEVLDSVLAQIQNVSISAKAMAKSNENVTLAIDAVAAISEESMASTQEVSAIAEEQSAASQEVTALAENLAGIAENLKESIAIFEVEQKNQS